MMATVPHVTSGLGLRKFQADGFLLTRVYILCHILINTQNYLQNLPTPVKNWLQHVLVTGQYRIWHFVSNRISQSTVCHRDRTILGTAFVSERTIGCPTRYRNRHFLNNVTTNEDIRCTTDTFVFISHTTNILLFKFRCNIFIGVRIIKEMPGSVASGTHCIKGMVLVSESYTFKSYTTMFY